MAGHLVSDPRLEIALGLGLLLGGFVVLHAAFDGRGRKKPLILGPFLPW